MAYQGVNPGQFKLRCCSEPSMGDKESVPKEAAEKLVVAASRQDRYRERLRMA